MNTTLKITPALTSEDETAAGRFRKGYVGSEADELIAQRMNQKSITCQEARAELVREKILADKEEGLRIPLPLRRALGIESKAEKALREARSARESAELVLREWDELVEKLHEKQQRVKRAGMQIGQLKSAAQSFRAEIPKCLGNAFDTNRVLNLASGVVKNEQILPLLEDATETLKSDLQAHVQQMREFGKANSVPEEILQKLPNEN
jgi:hypothetical protein